MTDPMTMDAVAEIGRRMKLDQVIEHGDDADEEAADLPGQVVAVRHGQVFAIVQLVPHPLAPRQAMYWCALTMRPDELYLIADGRFKMSGEGEPAPEFSTPGQFSDEWRAGQRDTMTEGIVISRIPAEGPASITIYPYQRDGAHLRWLEPHGPSLDMGGAVIDHARHGYDEAAELAESLTRLDELAGEIGMTTAEAWYRFDRAVARVVSEKEGVMAVRLVAGHELFIGGAEVMA